MMRVHSLGYVGFESPEAKAWESFGPDVLGAELAEPTPGGAVRLRLDDRHHRISVTPGDRDRVRYLGWELAATDDIEETAELLRAAGVTATRASDEELEERRVRSMVWCEDPAGHRHEFFYGQLEVPRSFRPGRAMSGFVTGGQGLGHVVLNVPDAPTALDFYRRVLGFRLSDEIDAMGMRLYFLHCNRRHHTLAVSERPNTRGLHHVMLQVSSIDDVGAAYDLCREKGVPIASTLGRHTNDRMVSFYMLTPSGFEIEYGWGAVEIDDEANWVVDIYDRGSIWGHDRSSGIFGGIGETV